MSQVDRHRRARALFEQLRGQPPDAQAAALAEACADDAALKQEVSRLLGAAAKAGSFLEHGATAALAGGADLIGQTIGPYEILSLLGVGGSGEVYRARDAVLGREVAVKFLRGLSGTDAERLVRFRREAQILASLNHPNIAAIYGLDEADGAPKLVLELVVGPTLADRLEHGALPLDETLRVARQIADALEAAHALGIVHRDLKPANVKLRADGTVKVLDFGLAKTLQPIVSGDSELTRGGTILGTGPYMSPEQARARAVDQRNDIWAFGCVLFEMLTGRRAFDGEGLSDTLAAILTQPPDWSLLPTGTPASVRRVLRRCLEKDQNRRLAHMADVRLELDEQEADGASNLISLPARATKRWLPWMTAAICAAGGLWLLKSIDEPVQDSTVYRTSLLLPGRLGDERNANGASVALSSDGRRLVFVASDEQGQRRLWIRALDELDARPLADTLNAQAPFWSPDGRWVAFVQDRRLKKVAIAGGPVVTLCDDAMSGGAWNSEDVILFTQPSGILAQVPAAGGTPSPVTTLDGNSGEAFNLNPFFLPGGRSFGYVSLGIGSVHTEVYLASLDGRVPRSRLPVDASVVQYASNYLWFLRGSTLMAQRFHPERHTVSGAAVPIAEQVRVENGTFRGGVFSVSEAGTLVLQRDPAPGNELVWYDRSGRKLGTLGAPADYADVQLSPDGQRALISVAPTSTAARDLWIFDVGRDLRTRFTFDDTRPIRTPIWSRDGSWIAFAAERDGRIVLMQKAVSGAEEPVVLLDDAFDKEPLSWSADGKHILYARRAAIAEPLSWVLPLDEGRAPFELAQPRVRYPQFSPDGRWLLYTSSESGRAEVFVAPFPGPGGSWQISKLGGLNGRWRADGGEIFYQSIADNRLMSAAVTLHSDRVDVGEVKPLFDLPWVGPRFTFDVSPDGERVLAVAQPSSSASAPLTLIVNWSALLEQ